jgi:membrane bound O-acyltransferase family protein
MQEWPRWAWMWLLALTVYATCKTLTWSATSSAGAPRWKRAAYLLAWPGMNPAAFFTTGPATLCCFPAEWAGATANLLLGTSLVFVLARRLPPGHSLLTGWIGMTGFVLILHFGAFHLLSCVWRALDCQANPLMNRPMVSTSLAEFWGRRWNTAFRDLTHRFLFKPLAARFGARWAVLGGFLVSGVVHDMVISVPAGGGYGGPTLYFAIQGLAVVFERSKAGQGVGLGRGTSGRLFALSVLVFPLGLLFHRSFIARIINPFMHAIGALP